MKRSRISFEFLPKLTGIGAYASLIGVCISVCVATVVVYELGFFGGLFVTFRSVPITASDLTIEIIRIVPAAIVLIGSYVFVSLRVKVAEMSMARGAGGNRRPAHSTSSGVLDRASIKRGIRFRERSGKLFLRKARAISISIFSFTFTIFVSSQIISGIFGSPAIGAMGGISFMLMFYWPLCLGSALTKNVLFHLMVIANALIIINIWGTYNAFVAMDHAQLATITLNKDSDQAHEVRIVDAFEKGLLVLENDSLKFQRWDSIASVDYGAPSRVKQLESTVCGYQAPPNCLERDGVH